MLACKRSACEQTQSADKDRVTYRFVQSFDACVEFYTAINQTQRHKHALLHPAGWTDVMLSHRAEPEKLQTTCD